MIALLATSQEDYLKLSLTKEYPKLVEISGDTVVVFTPDHVKKMNKTFIELDLANKEIEVLDSVNVALMDYKSLSDTVISAQSYQLSLRDSMFNEKDLQIEILKKSNTARGEQIKRLKKSRKFYLGTGLISGVLSLALIRGLFGA